MSDINLHTQICFIGLGSNLNEPISQVLTALDELASHPDISLIARSPLYRSAPVGPAGQPDYINAAAKIETLLTPLDLLEELQAIEQKHQRIREQHWGPRTLDLDLLLYGNITLDTEKLTIPHPYLTERNFVLRPLADLDEELSLPDGRKIIQCLADCPMGSLVQLSL